MGSSERIRGVQFQDDRAEYEERFESLVQILTNSEANSQSNFETMRSFIYRHLQLNRDQNGTRSDVPNLSNDDVPMIISHEELHTVPGRRVLNHFHELNALLDLGSQTLGRPLSTSNSRPPTSDSRPPTVEARLVHPVDARHHFASNDMTVIINYKLTVTLFYITI